MTSPEIVQAKVSAKGWSVIPAKLRRRDARATVVVFQEADDKIIVIPRVSDPIEEFMASCQVNNR